MIRDLPQQFLLECLHYSPATGVLEWLERPVSHFSSEAYARRWNTKHAGKKAGTRTGAYSQVTFSGQKLYAHRVIWKMVMGENPEYIDHIDGDTKNNRWMNLRSVTPSESSRNLPRTSKNTSGHTGVSCVKPSGKWLAYIKTEGKMVRLGAFSLKQDAIDARKAAERKRGFHPNHGRARSNQEKPELEDQ